MKLLAAASRDGSSVLPAGGTLDLQSANSPAIVIGKPLLIGKISMDTNGTYDPPILRPLPATSLSSVVAMDFGGDVTNLIPASLIFTGP